MGGEPGRVTAVLGPTNTGKTHYAIERMLAHRTGVIGLPLRLLAREVYDRIVALRGPSVVGLVTGEERIVPPRVQYWVCTVEAMPQGIGADFVAVDEIQLCADPERGHVFTDRLLHMRGLHETLFLGAETMRGAIAAQVPGAQFLHRERFSQLSYSGARKVSRMPARSAIVGFSVESVYAMAELLRRQKGGAAVVMGALSPRTRNAQVAMYQNGDVDYLVATDAIGMGLNLDVNHVAFAATAKFDGRRMRQLTPGEMAQIAGRAGRYMQNGTFGVTGEAGPLDEEVIEAITEHRFAPVRKLHWRNSTLDFGTADRLIGALEARAEDPWLTRVREADDLMALKALAGEPEIAARLDGPQAVKLLWDVCRIPDFRGISHAEHAGLLSRIFADLHDHGRVPDEWFARQIRRIDRTEGDIDTLSKRLAFIRTWTYVAQRKGWLADEEHWRGATRAVEDRLSDALHGALTQRFVDRRTSVLLRRLKQKESLVAEVNDKGEVSVEGQHVGRLDGFRFTRDRGASPEEGRTLRQAALAALAPEFNLRADRFYNAPDTEMDFTDQGGLMWGDTAVGKLVKGDDALKPRVVAFVDDEAGAEVAQKVERRLQHFIDRKIAALFEPLLTLGRDEALTGLARGFAFRMVEALGVLPRDEVAGEVKELDQDARGALRKHGIRFGQFTIFMPLLLKPAPTRLRLLLWSLFAGHEEAPESPPPGLVTIPATPGAPDGYYPMSGYRLAGDRAIRIDMLERLADLLRAENSRAGFEATPDMLSITGMTLEQFAGLMQGLGYRAERGERTKARPADAAIPGDASGAGEAVGADAAVDTPEDAAPADDRPVMDVAEDAAPGAVTGEAEGREPPAEMPEAIAPEAPAGTPEIAPDERPAGSAEPADEGRAPVDEVPADAPPAPATPEAGDEEALPGTAPDEAVAAPETEVFYTFTWAGNRGRGGERGARREGGKQGGGRRRGPDGKEGGKPGGKHGKQGGPRGRNGKGGQGDGGKPRSFEARPPRKEKPIDPDNPFAAALMGLKDRK